MKSAKTYERFIDDDFNIIKDEFYKLKGLSVETTDDFCTYDGWMDRKRKVKRGEKSLKVLTSQSYPQPLFYYGAPKTDEKGKILFAKYPKEFALFHLEQTEPLTL
jgi:hypothetical protein